MCYIYQYVVGNGIVVTIVQVNRVEDQELTGCFKYCNGKTQIYTRIREDLTKKKRVRIKGMTQIKLQSERVSNK